MVPHKLQVGQLVEMKEYSHGFECVLVAPGETGQEILEVGHDYIVVKGNDLVAWVRYPCYLLRFKEAAPPPAETVVTEPVFTEPVVTEAIAA